jgi:general secretion pathway protein K
MVFYKRRRQSGMALLFALLIVVLAVTVSVSISHELWFSIRKTSHMQLNSRSSLYALGLEDWARLFLQKDKKDSKTDHLQEDWAIGVPGLPIEGGYLAGYLEDEQGKFNVNNLLGPEETVKRFKRLCHNLEVDATFVPALQDWIDSDLDVRYPDGAEEHYDTYRVANQPMADVSELLLVKGVTIEMLDKLRPYITALPTATNLNVNTMSETIYLSLDENLDAGDFLEKREDAEFKDINDFITRMQKAIAPEGLSIDSEYFRAYGQIVQGDQTYSVKTLLSRNDKGLTSVLNRTLEQF